MSPGKADVAQEVRLLQAVERLARGADEQLDTDQEQDRRRRPGIARARGGGRPHRRERRAPLLARPPAEAVLGHEGEAAEAAGDREDAAEDHARAERDHSDADLREQPEHRADLAVARAAQEDAADVLEADLVRDPGLLGAAREGVREAPERPERDDQPRRRDEPDREPGDAHPEVADDQREPAAVGVGHDAGRHLAEEDRRLHRRPHQHELERREVQLAHQVDRHHDPRRQVRAELEPEVDRAGRERPHGFSQTET